MVGLLKRVIFGPAVANHAAEGRKLGLLAGLPAMGLDGLGSASYGPEAALSILAAAGSAGLATLAPIFWIITGLLAILWFSYWQTIAAYPNNGGSYIVAKDNLGRTAGLLAAAALMIDYLLNAAVGVSAGIGALISAVPALHAHTLALCLAVLFVVALINLRGSRESGLAWAVPTYTFVLSLMLIIAWGGYKVLAGSGAAVPVVAPPAAAQSAGAVTLWLVLRAFAAGCTAMTGVEAVSNGVSSFREPPVRHAHRTLSAIVIILGVLLLGIVHLARAYGITAMDQSQPAYQSVISQLIGAVYGRGWLYDVAIFSVLAVLCLSANTSFVDFPRLCRLVAADGFLPRAFAVPGRSLVYTVGVVVLTLGAGGLLIAFGGITDRLIPLFAVGAFLSFTLSQGGMAVRWRRALAQPDGTGARRPWLWARFAINGGGAIATAVALGIILVAKFSEGAWLTFIIIPATLLLLKTVRRYYDRIERQILTGQRELDLADRAPPVALVPIKRWDRLSRKAVAYALRLTPDLTAVHITRLEGPDSDDDAARLRHDWQRFVAAPARRAGLPAPQLLLVSSPFRSIVVPLLRAVEQAEAQFPNRPVIVVLPELVEGRWWGNLMHAHRERRLRTRLLKYGGAGIGVVSIPWQVLAARPADGIAAEETAVGAPAGAR